MLVRDYAARVGRISHETRRAYICKRHVAEAAQHIELLKKRRIQSDVLADAYYDRAIGLFPDLSSVPMYAFVETPENAQRLNHAIQSYAEYYTTATQKENVDQEIHRTLMDQTALIHDIAELRTNIAASLAELAADGPPTAPGTAFDILQRAHECLRDTAEAGQADRPTSEADRPTSEAD